MVGFGLGFQEIVIIALGAALAIGVVVAMFLSGGKKGGLSMSLLLLLAVGGGVAFAVAVVVTVFSSGGKKED